MTFTRYKKFGKKEYAYEIKSFWDSETKKCRQKSVYLGVVVDKNKKIYEKRSLVQKQEKLILDFGDSYFIKELFQTSEISQLIENVFGKEKNSVLAMINYRLCSDSAMKHFKTWFSGNYAKICYPNINLSSQRISEFFEFLGSEGLQRRFFKEYFKRFVDSNKGIIIDGTSLPNEIHIPITKWGKNDGAIDMQIRFLLVVDKKSSEPLYFRYLSGNIVDVSTLINTIAELKKFGVNENYAYLDAGFFSEENIKEMYTEKIDFLTRLPSIKNIYKELILNEVKGIEKVENAVRYGKRILFVKQKQIDLFGKEAYAYVILDPERKGREVKNFLLENIENKETQKEEIDYEMTKKGIFILVSSFKMKNEEVVPAYYVRQAAERLFGFAKNDLGILPLRAHNEDTIRGVLFLQFLSLVCFTKIKEKIGKKHSVEEVLLILRNLKCKVYDNEILVSEQTKQQREVFEQMGILVPKKAGI